MDSKWMEIQFEIAARVILAWLREQHERALDSDRRVPPVCALAKRFCHTLLDEAGVDEGNGCSLCGS